MKSLTAEEAGDLPLTIDAFGDAPTMEEADGLIGPTGMMTELKLTFEDLEGLSVPQRLSMHRKVLFLRAFAKRGIIIDGIRAAGISRDLVTHWKTQPWFKERFDAAIEEAADFVEGELHRRAVEGVDEPVMFQGQPTTVRGEDGRSRVLTVKRYSDPLLMMLAKGVRREKFGDKIEQKIDLTAKVGVLVVPGLVDPATWEQTANEQQAKYAGNTGDLPAIEHDKGK